MANTLFYTYFHPTGPKDTEENAYSSYKYNDGKIPNKILGAYFDSLIFDVKRRTIWHQGWPFGHTFWGASYGEIYNDYENNKAYGFYGHAEGYDTYVNGWANHAEGSSTYVLSNAAHAEGVSTSAYGEASHVEGVSNSTYGDYSHAEGGFNVTYAPYSHVEGIGTKTYFDEEKNWLAPYSHSEGYYTYTKGDSAHAEGKISYSDAIASHAEGFNTHAIGDYSHSEGNKTVTKGESSHAEGNDTIASNKSAHAEGSNTTASGESSHAEGNSQTTASGIASHAEGTGTKAEGDYSHSEGIGAQAKKTGSHAEGNITTADGNYSHAEGNSTIALGESSHSEGISTHANKTGSHAEGNNTTADGDYSHAEGNDTKAYGEASHSEGNNKTEASGVASHAEGDSTKAEGNSSHSEGDHTLASNKSAHAEGSNTTASGESSHAEGNNKTTASGIASHAEGSGTTAAGNYSHTEGNNVKTLADYSHVGGKDIEEIPTTAKVSFAHGEGVYVSRDNEVAFGKFNAHDHITTGKEDNKEYYLQSAFTVGRGTEDNKRFNLFEVTLSGTAYVGVSEDKDKLGKPNQLVDTLNYYNDKQLDTTNTHVWKGTLNEFKNIGKPYPPNTIFFVEDCDTDNAIITHEEFNELTSKIEYLESMLLNVIWKSQLTSDGPISYLWSGTNAKYIEALEAGNVNENERIDNTGFLVKRNSETFGTSSGDYIEKVFPPSEKDGIASGTVFNGVYIMATNGLLYEVSEWKTRANYAVGVYVKDNNKDFIISKDELNLIFYKDNSLNFASIVPGMHTQSPTSDYNGSNYTEKLFKYYNNELHYTDDSAPRYAYEYQFKDGKNGYIPSGGEMQIIANNLYSINKALERIGGISISTNGDLYWTSNTQSGSNIYCVQFKSFGFTAVNPNSEHKLRILTKV